MVNSFSENLRASLRVIEMSLIADWFISLDSTFNNVSQTVYYKINKWPKTKKNSWQKRIFLFTRKNSVEKKYFFNAY